MLIIQSLLRTNPVCSHAIGELLSPQCGAPLHCSIIIIISLLWPLSTEINLLQLLPHAVHSTLFCVELQCDKRLRFHFTLWSQLSLCSHHSLLKNRVVYVPPLLRNELIAREQRRRRQTKQQNHGALLQQILSKHFQLLLIN